MPSTLMGIRLLLMAPVGIAADLLAIDLVEPCERIGLPRSANLAYGLFEDALRRLSRIAEAAADVEPTVSGELGAENFELTFGEPCRSEHPTHCLPSKDCSGFATSCSGCCELPAPEAVDLGLTVDLLRP